MADDRHDPDTPADPVVTPRLSASPGCVLQGFVLCLLVGTAVAVAARQFNAPLWVIPAGFLVPLIVAALVFVATAVPRLARQIREAARNAPSPESVAAAAGTGVEARRGALIAAEFDAPTPADDTPGIEPATTSPGKTLAYRLHRTGMPAGCQFGCALFGALFWNGIVGVFAYQAIDKWNRGVAVRWFEWVYLVPFALVGLVLILAAAAAALKWLLSALVGSVEVELSAHPLAPGMRAQLHVAQAGLFPLGRVAVTLVCAEEATYVAGTSKATAKKDVASHSVTDPEQSPDGGALPLAAEFTVPAGAMHSFDAPNNKITWTVRVTGRVLGLLPYSEDYGATVAPG
jgi:hypothetical protein